MKSHSSFRLQINPKSHSGHSRVDLQKMCAPQREIGWWHVTPKWPDMHVGRGTCGISINRCGPVGILTFAALMSAAIVADIPAADADHAPGSPMFRCQCHDCNADPPLPDFTPSDDGADVSANSFFAATVDSIAQRTEHRIRNDAKNVVCQQMPRSMRKLSLGWR